MKGIANQLSLRYEKSVHMNCAKLPEGFLLDIQASESATDYNEKLSKLEALSPDAAHYLRGTKPEEWCLWPHVWTHALHGHRTSNYVESSNSAILQIRSMSPLNALDAMVQHQREHFADLRASAERRLEKGHIVTSYAQKLYDAQRDLAAIYSVSLSNNRYGYAAKFEQGELARYEVDLADLTCSCPYSVQYELSWCHLIAVAQRQGLTRDKDAWMRATCAKFLQRDYHTTLQGCVVRQVPMQHLSPDGVTTGPAICVPRRRKRPPKTPPHASEATSIPVAKKQVGRPRKIKPTEPEGVIVPIQMGNEPTGPWPQTPETRPGGSTIPVIKKPRGRPRKTKPE
ncbi:mutatorlike transposase [Perkinsela sp. CCAP 1560/4]|nr:mutatorlike transposase [Perkinsela sp. CCAP 1560/4]KNH08696.1 mutatorlike transposase [Perkinsela sp. CCAP 1560/4]|eukprot:KNH05628.1 mutatorlike transposase [Perkinsela sp. CCAP 1560/4]